MKALMRGLVEMQGWDGMNPNGALQRYAPPQTCHTSLWVSLIHKVDV